jgi:hypothetical protein
MIRDLNDRGPGSRSRWVGPPEAGKRATATPGPRAEIHGWAEAERYWTTALDTAREPETGLKPPTWPQSRATFFLDTRVGAKLSLAEFAESFLKESFCFLRSLREALLSTLSWASPSGDEGRWPNERREWDRRRSGYLFGCSGERAS